MSSVKPQASTLPRHYPSRPLENRENEELLRSNCSADTKTEPNTHIFASGEPCLPPPEIIRAQT
ncbi:hypothetical protein N7466_003290 [Penicillium verhagenii]|uniref:uncharacterized protein n=1 Tax=Penicillium verhagenii TaxID=1562060 RepID=UPI002545B783|nr:uncharacterized protein N7466_003290 [Penicillium verhagenii]KAJ5936840.1 hypothetical protein N7466_003290 [Penicillium verhagenii]